MLLPFSASCSLNTARLLSLRLPLSSACRQGSLPAPAALRGKRALVTAEPSELLLHQRGYSPEEASRSLSSTSGRYFTKSQEWFEVEGEGVGIVGITQRAQRALGEIVHCRLPREGDVFEVMQTIATLEALKSVGEVKSPVKGEVIEVNPRLDREPGLVTFRPQDEGWLVRLAFSGPIPRYLRGSRAVARSEVHPFLVDKEGLQRFILQRLGETGSDDALQELTFDGLAAFERRWLHEAAQELGLVTQSRGAGQGRQLLVRRDVDGLPDRPEDSADVK